MLKDNQIFVRIVKQEKVKEDVSLAAAKKLIHKGWEIEDPRFDSRGRLREVKEEVDLPEPIIETEMVTDEELEREAELEVIDEGLDLVKKKRSVKALEDIIKNYSEYEPVVEAAKTKIEKING